MAAASTSSVPTRSNGAEIEAIASGTSTQGAARRQPTVPDLLISYKGKYKDWVEKVKAVSYKNMEASCATRVLDAQVRA